jgi:hypothetical protein
MQLRAAVPAATTRDLRQATTRGARVAIRIGYLTRGVVYGLIGILSLLWALRQAGGRVTDGHGAVDRIGQQSWGAPLLWAIAIGLACYATWNLIRAVFDPEHRGRDRKAIIARIAYAGSAASQGVLAVYALQLAIGAAEGGSHERSFAQLLSLPAGRIAVGIFGLGVIGFGLYELFRAYKNEVEHDYHGGLPASQRKLVVHMARIGLAARGVVFPLIGISLIAAASAADPSHAHGFGEALLEISRQAYGRALLGIVAAGLIAYAAHMFFMACYARFPVRV